jgi:hypothetical protein
MPVVWERSGEAFYATSQDDQSGERCCLVVDALPNGGWDWSVWRQPVWRPAWSMVKSRA